MANYFEQTGINHQKIYKRTSPQTWCDSLEGIGVLRNCLTHGETKVTEKLLKAANQKYSIVPTFKENKKDDNLAVTLVNLQLVEQFSDQLLTAINFCLLEIAQT